MIKDSISDSSLHLIARVLKDHDLPTYVKLADLYKSETGVNRFGYALPAERLLPCNTKLACYLSHAYYYAQQAKLASDKHRKYIEDSLAQFARLHEITEDVAKLASIPEWAPTGRTRKIASRDLRNLDGLSPMDLILYAREQVETMGSKLAVDPSLAEWIFPNQFVALDRQILSLQKERPDDAEDLGKLASAVEPMSPRRSWQELPVIAEALGVILDDNALLQSKMAGWPTRRYPAIRLASRFYHEEDLQEKLAEIDRLIVPDLYGSPIRTLKSNWQDIVEGSSLPDQRKVASLFSPAV